MIKRLLYTFASTVILLLSACSVDPSTHILWSNPELSNSGATANTQVYTLRTLNIPKYLERQQLVVKPASGTTYIQFLPEQRWEEPLDSNLRRVITQNLNQLFQAPVVYRKPHFNMADTSIIDLDIFEWVIDEKNSHLLLSAVWQLNAPDTDGHQRFEFKKTYTIDMESPQLWANAYQQATDDLSLAIFETL